VNRFQEILVKTYANGDYNGQVSSDAEAAEVGDTLFLFLWRELSTSEDCEDTETAIARVGMAIEDLEGVLHALER
jgi:hypothetical protein